MTLSLFDQFASPKFIEIPLIIIAVSLPAILILSTNTQFTNNRPTTLQYWLKIMFIKQLFLPVSSNGRKWTAILTSLMMFLTTANLLGLLPYTFTPTTQLSLNMSMAMPMWLATVLTGLKNQPTIALGHLLPEGTPTPLIPALILIETISLLIRPMALGVRLTANLVAGHLLMQLISMATTTIMTTLPVAAALTFLTLLLLTLLELAVALIQAFVFTLLLSLYLQENT
uniref:ATP synthase F0 subunit 6 n=1 Tax=Varanus nebulosus TaxID=735376 RepID=UPI002435BD3D|nr:ATP synthase F0 subunit 6 [Varanus nebulosus]WEU77709.1 ATP synthase F0 subunit 6 [Varanus nebulosus]